MNKQKIKSQIKHFKNNWKLITKDKLIVIVWLTALAIILVSLGLLITNIKPVSFEVPVKFSPYSKRTGNWYELFSIPISGLVMMFINSLIAIKFYDTERLISYISVVVLVFFSLMILLQSALFAIFLGAL
jgi:uncharacterized membrane protein